MSDSGSLLRSAGLLALDVDGVLTDGTLLYGPEGVSQSFSSTDGAAIVGLRRSGFPVALISFRDLPATRRRASALGIDLLCLGTDRKDAALERVCMHLGLDISKAVFMGDGPMDLPALRIAGVSVCPANAHCSVIAQCDLVTSAPGGRGAVAELIKMLNGSRDLG